MDNRRNKSRQKRVLDTVREQLDAIMDYEPEEDGDLSKFVEDILMSAFLYRSEHEEVPEEVYMDEDYKSTYVELAEIDIVAYVFKLISTELIGKWKQGDLQRLYSNVLRVGRKRGWNTFALQTKILEELGITGPTSPLGNLSDSFNSVLFEEDIPTRLIDYN